ncbi:MAG: Gfo/Idh/MocA family oxidoreductase [Tepidisphaeraceae bacterium]
MRVGIIGLGMMGRTHYEAYQEIGATVVAVADQDPKRARGDLTGTGGNVIAGALSQLPMDKIKGTTDASELIAMQEVDIVDICLPTTQHVEIAIEALRAGKHVICEKPLARISSEAEKIAAAARQATGAFMPAMCMRFWPQWAWLKQAVVEQRYGKVQAATFRRVASMPAGWYRDGKMSGGAALDLHIHDTDFVQFLFGMPKAVSSRGYTKTSGEIDHLTTQFIYDDVPLVSAEGGWCMADGFSFSMQYTVNFENATADFDLACSEQPLKLFAEGKSEPIDCGPGYGYAKELKYFIDCVSNGEKPTIVTADDAVRSIKLVEAEVKSIRSGEVVKV